MSLDARAMLENAKQELVQVKEDRDSAFVEFKAFLEPLGAVKVLNHDSGL